MTIKIKFHFIFIGAVIDPVKYDNLLMTAPWHVGNLFDDVEDKVYYWNTIMQDIMDECFPQKKKRVRDKDIPYMTTAWKNAIRAKRRAFKKYLNERTQQNWEEKVKCRNEATRQRRIAVRQYWKKKTSDLKVLLRSKFNVKFVTKTLSFQLIRSGCTCFGH